MFDTLPLHPAVVHAPIGISILLPLLTILVGVLMLKSNIGKNGILVLLVSHLALVGASYAALETGEDEEHTVEEIVGKKLVEEHEERGEAFMIGSVISFLLALGLLILPKTNLLLPGLGALLLAQFVTLFLGYRVGHSGGELVYVHGAARAYIDSAPDLSHPQETEEESSHSEED